MSCFFFSGFFLENTFHAPSLFLFTLLGLPSTCAPYAFNFWNRSIVKKGWKGHQRKAAVLFILWEFGLFMWLFKASVSTFIYDVQYFVQFWYYSVLWQFSVTKQNMVKYKKVLRDSPLNWVWRNLSPDWRFEPKN